MHQPLYRHLRLSEHVADADDHPAPQSQDDDALHLPAETDVGVLDILPLELLQDVVSHLDLRSLTSFRSVNRRATEIALSLREYRAITTHYQSSLCVMLAVDTSRRITCRTLYAALRTSTCKRCGDEGGYLFTSTCERLCTHCLSEASVSSLFFSSSSGPASRLIEPV
ncbi:uncharacterized protein GGS25DRAFT_506479 [Hypoxylon fragiforme]|uniref:uncharacterized protein n=1 Tax=Hypoxylon fragiforme TaxID=63214 RepID=UPI0020C6B810|nr:uncharacterized protein GGS25DRAFT_506479 [Hypoxylon fragiforme]KAI2603993.1 hypothetical protein GGS25DRAFT_506479 [Hypoxylon fragiforme]